MDRDEILQKIKDVISDQIAIDEDDIELDSSLEDDLDVDSLDLLQIVTAIEDEFNITIDDDAFESVKTVGDAVNYIEKIL